MNVGGKGSGGHNALPAEVHLLRGTYQPSRHGPKPEAPDVPVSEADRRRVLAGLGPEARRLAARLLDEYQGWDAAALVSLRLYVESVARLTTITDDAERRRETRIMLALHKSLELDR